MFFRATFLMLLLLALFCVATSAAIPLRDQRPPVLYRDDAKDGKGDGRQAVSAASPRINGDGQKRMAPLNAASWASVRVKYALTENTETVDSTSESEAGTKNSDTKKSSEGDATTTLQETELTTAQGGQQNTSQSHTTGATQQVSSPASVKSADTEGGSEGVMTTAIPSSVEKENEHATQLTTPLSVGESTPIVVSQPHVAPHDNVTKQGDTSTPIHQEGNTDTEADQAADTASGKQGAVVQSPTVSETDATAQTSPDSGAAPTIMSDAQVKTTAYRPTAPESTAVPESSSASDGSHAARETRPSFRPPAVDGGVRHGATPGTLLLLLFLAVAAPACATFL